MIATESVRSNNQREAHVTGWFISILLHFMVAFAALLLVKQTHLRPQDEPFKWNVAMISPAQPVQPTASSRDHAPAASVQTTTTAPSPRTEQSASAQTLPSPQPLALQTAPSAHEPPANPVATEPNPTRPTASVQPATQTTQPSEATKQEGGEPRVTEALSNVNPAAAPTIFSDEPSVQATVSSTPSAIFDQSEQPVQSPTPAQMAAVSSPSLNTQAKPDYGWLTETISRRVEELRHYPASARLDTAEGKVVVKFVIHEDGSIGEAEVFQSSGRPDLDKAALEILRRATPFHLPRPLGKPRMTLKVPIKYFLD